MTKLCLACDAELPPPVRTKGRKRRYCSTTCAAWAYNHPGEKRPKERRCLTCGKDISHMLLKAKVCSKRCDGVLRGKVRAEPLPDATCTTCGTAFPAKRVDAKYCSDKCRDSRPRSERKQQPWSERKRPRSYRGRVCEACGELYDATWKGQRTCSRACGARIREARHAEVVRLCACGTTLTRGRFKCDSCLLLSRKRRKERDKRRRRAAKRGARSEPYTLAEIAARDRNMCQLCKKRVAMTKTVPDPKAPVIDHVLPLACGGDDTRANVQLAHFLCNSIKSAGGSQQLALVG